MSFDLFLSLQVMFETYQFSGVYIAIQAVLTLYAQGKQIAYFYKIQNRCEIILNKKYEIDMRDA